MLGQDVLVSLAFVLAALYLGCQTWRTWSAKGCAGGCGKGTSEPGPAPLIAPEDLLLRVRQRQQDPRPT